MFSLTIGFGVSVEVSAGLCFSSGVLFVPVGGLLSGLESCASVKPAQLQARQTMAMACFILAISIPHPFGFTQDVLFRDLPKLIRLAATLLHDWMPPSMPKVAAPVATRDSSGMVSKSEVRAEVALGEDDPRLVDL